MAVSEDLLQKYLDNVPGHHAEIKWKKEALRSLAAIAPTPAHFMKYATPFVKDENGDCGMLFKCPDGSCVANKDDCQTQG